LKHGHDGLEAAYNFCSRVQNRFAHIILVRDDGALSAGAKWGGVWTRDVSLSAILSLALVAPDATRRSLLAKVDSSGRIIQDTGTGGSWPVSSDRMVWALAAWELYAATGDGDWLRQSYDIIRRSADADLHAVRDPATGLFSFSEPRSTTQVIDQAAMAQIYAVLAWSPSRWNILY